jgi:amino acid adenylation domain-containing protein
VNDPTAEKRAMLRRLLQDRAEKRDKATPLLAADIPPMRPVPRNGPMKLSFGQEMIWLLEQIAPEVMFYNIVERFQIRGHVDVDVLRLSIDEVIKRHEILRTVYLNVNGQPVQKVEAPSPVRLRFHDLRQVVVADRDEEARQLIVAEVRTQFDLSVGPMVRPMLLRIANDDFIFALIIHHMAIDGYSLRLFVDEIASFYTAVFENRIPSLPALPVQYVDFAHWQRRWLNDERLSTHRNYWRGKLGQNPPALNLRTDYMPPAARTFASATYHVSVGGDVLHALKEIGRQQEATLFTVLLAAFGTLLMRYSGQDDFVIGGVMSDRARPEVEHVIGFFVNSLALRLDLSGDLTFNDLVARTRTIVFEAQEHGAFPFHRLVEIMQPKRSANSNPFAQVFMNMLNLWDREDVTLPDASIRPLGGLDLHMPVDLFTLFAAVSGSSLQMTFVYSTELFERETIERMADDLRNILAAAAASPQTRIKALPVNAPGPGGGDRASSLMARLTKLGVNLAVEDGRLKVNAPKGVLTDALKAALAEQRDAIIRSLNDGARQQAASEHVLGPTDRRSPLPLTAVQRRFWFLDRIGQGEGNQNVVIPLKFEGDFDIVAMKAALMFLFERHEILRLRLGDKEGEPYPEISPLREDTVKIVDLAHLPRTEAEQEGERLCQEFIQTRFDLATGPVANALLVRLAQKINWVTVCMHHIVADGWSSSIMVRELSEIYSSLKRGDVPALPPLALQYVDYAAWEVAQVRSGLFDRQLAYWKTKLKGAPPVLTLPTDFPRRSERSTRGGRYDCIVEADLVRRLQEFSQRHDTTLFMTMLAAFGVVLHRWTSQDDIVVGTPIANRANPNLERIVGPFVNSLSLRMDIGTEQRFTDYLAQVRRTVIEAIDHRDLPFDMVVEALNPARTLNHAPIFQVMFALHNFPMEQPRFDDLTVSLLVPEATVARLDVMLDMAVVEGRLYGAWEYDAELFERLTIERMHAALMEVVKGFLATAETRVTELPLRTIDDDRLLDTWNYTAAEHDRSMCVHQAFERVASRAPQAPAVIAGGETFTYGDIDTGSNRLAHLLLSRGVGLGDRVAIYLDRTIDVPVTLLGVLKAGAAYVPLDPSHPAERIRYVIEDAQIACIVTIASLRDVLPATEVPTICLDAVKLETFDGGQTGVAVGPDNVAYAIYTSGSTGRPKGVEVEHRNLASFIAAMRLKPGIATSDVLLAVTTLSFDIAGLEIWLPLCFGAKVVLASRSDALEGSRLNTLVNEHDVTVMQATPSTWRLMIGAGFQGKPNLKALCGGEALPPDLATDLVPRVGQLWNMYGPTETTIWSTTSLVAENGVLTIGRPIANTRVYVVEPWGCLAPIGGLGELLIGGEGVARGYWNRPELTAQRFDKIQLPSGQVERVYRTGDVVRFRNDGQLEFHGRRDHQVKLRGYRIEPGEIEATLISNATIESCVVKVCGEESSDARLVAYVVPKAGATFDREEVRVRLKAHLPSYMVPAEFVTMNSMPLTPNGKVDRAALAAPLPPNGTEQMLSANVIMTPLQQRVAELWCKVLRINRVSLNDNFFDVGGHSMLVVRLHVALQQEFGTDIILAELFQRTTVAAQAERMSMAGRGDAGLRRAEARVKRLING